MTDNTLLAKREAIARALPAEVGSTERVRRLHAELHAAPHTICLHRARTYTRGLPGN